MSRSPLKSSALNFAYLQLEGGLFVPEHLEKAVSGGLDFQKSEDYEVLPGLKLNEEISRYFQIAQAQWNHFDARRKRADVAPLRITEEFVSDLLCHALGFGKLDRIDSVTIDVRVFPIQFMARGHVPVIIAPHDQDLDEAHERFAVLGAGIRRKSAFQLAQEFLNASEKSLWALVTNGRQLRLLRDTSAMTRPVWLEVDLEQILMARDWAAFNASWRIFHGSRAGKPDHSAEDCIWEKWRKQGLDTGLRVRESLRLGVQEALVLLGTGFLQNPANEALRTALQTGTLRSDAYFQELLRLIYRYLFLFAVEERDLLHPEGSSETAIKLYGEGYSQKRLRERCLRPGASPRHGDIWQGQRIVWLALEKGEPALALPALGGLFKSSQCPYLDAAQLSNAALMQALRALRWSGKTGSFASVDYRNMGPEELGSVYESLLELVPRIDLEIHSFGFVGFGGDEGSTKGNARKTTGSYYTPDSLVQELLKTSLDPVIADKVQQNPQDPEAALLSLRVIDSSCGSGHFLLAAARRIAERLAQVRSADGAVRPADYRHALRDVIGHCIFGVDRNPMAIELARTALWLESFEAERPLSFIDHHLLCGDALLGLMDLKTLDLPIPDKAFAALSGDDKAIAKELAAKNKDGVKSLKKSQEKSQVSLELFGPDTLQALGNIDDLSDDTLADIDAKDRAYAEAKREARQSKNALLADLWVAAFLIPKTQATKALVPTTQSLVEIRYVGTARAEVTQILQASQLTAEKARVLHWPLAFPGVFAKGGFDVVLGNPPWERIKLQEEEFFATRHALIAEAKNKAERGQRIEWLAEGTLQRNLSPDHKQPDGMADLERGLYAEFLEARRIAEAASVYFHIAGEDGGRYPLTGVGDVNTYALFAETIRQLLTTHGRAGFIVPTGIATDDSTKRYFGSLVTQSNLYSLISFKEIRKWFPGTDDRNSFCLLSLGKAEIAQFRFSLDDEKDFSEVRKAWELTAQDFQLINPNTLTCPTFRSRQDAELTKKIYRKVPVLWREAREKQPESNPWGIKFNRLFDMSNDSHLFQDASAEDRLPLYEAKMIHQFDHRWATYAVSGLASQSRQFGDEEEDAGCRNVALHEKADPTFTVQPRYWVNKREVLARVARVPKDVVQAWYGREAEALGRELGLWQNSPIPAKDRDQIIAGDWDLADAWMEKLSPKWLMGFRNIARSTDERTFIASITPLVPIGHSMPIIELQIEPRYSACFLGCVCSIITDFIVRQKLGGINMTFGYVKQFAVLPPNAYSQADLDFIVPRVLELTYTAHDLKGWAEDLGYTGSPFAYDLDRRALLRAELDARYARLYGLNRDELRYILDPADVMGADYPTETFRVLKNREMGEFGEYRTRRLVLEAWDKGE
jgi:hypothetical protein